MGLNVPLFNENAILNEVLGLETVVQFIEASFYIMFGFILPSLSSVMDIAIFRYADWFITTPMMLLSTLSFMDYIRRKESPTDDPTTKEIPTLKSFITKHSNMIMMILMANATMLLMGYLHESGMIDVWTSTIFGFMAFAVVFYLMYKEFAHHHKINEYLWYYMCSTWSLYGVAAVFPNVAKNTMYNMLDIVSKNFYSVFLTTYILGLKK